ncbi:MAG: shikimate kinase, partial [Chthoniobacterales bacterium]
SHCDAPSFVTPALRSIVLIGFMGSGKSSVGRLLARELGWPRFDTDQLVVGELGLRIPEIFVQLGEARFREGETQALANLGTATAPAVIVTGGGIVLRPENVRRLHELGSLVWLQAEPAVLHKRLARRADRPLLQTPDPAATIAQLLAERQRFYAEAADFAIDTSRLDHGQVAKAIRDELQIGR